MHYVTHGVATGHRAWEPDGLPCTTHLHDVAAISPRRTKTGMQGTGGFLLIGAATFGTPVRIDLCERMLAITLEMVLRGRVDEGLHIKLI